MKKINFKNLIPGLISIVVIAGMAFQSLATNIDLAAFVPKDIYMEKYYDLEFRARDIQNSIERTYKFVCTNVKTFGGYEVSHSLSKTMFDGNSSSHTYHWWNRHYADLRVDGYLRFAKPIEIGKIGPPAKILNFKFEIPASHMKWRDDIELTPSCKVKINVDRPGLTSETTTVTMGPFKKFPRITTTGSGISQGWVCEFPYMLTNNAFAFSSTMTYNYGTETEPTSWRSDNGIMSLTYNSRGNSASKFPRKTAEDVLNGYDVGTYDTFFYVSTAMSNNIQNFENVWIRFIHTSNHFLRYGDLSRFDITNWNKK